MTVLCDICLFEKFFIYCGKSLCYQLENNMENQKKAKTFKFPEKLFETDPVTGKLIPLPLGNNENTDIRREITENASLPSESKHPLEPLDFKNLFPDDRSMSSQTKRRRNPSDFKELFSDSKDVSCKIRKFDKLPNSARRLFQSQKQGKSRSSCARQSTSRISVASTRMRIPRISTSSKSSPLLNMEEVEQNLLKTTTNLTSYPFKSPDLPNFKFNKLTNTLSKSKKLEIPRIIIEECEFFSEQMNNDTMGGHEPKTPDSIEDFHKFERLCKDSPVTSMCNKMQDTTIHSAKRTKLNFDINSELLEQIEKLKDDEKIRHEKFIREEEIRHEKNISMLDSILATVKKLTQNERNENENQSTTISRRSERLLKKSPLVRSNLLTSPAIPKSVDLRKNTLKKNLVSKSIDYQICNPQAHKQRELSNSLSSRNNIYDTPRSYRELSVRFEEQYRLLQDTPIHK